MKVTALLGDLLDLDRGGAEYGAYTINISKSEQSGSGFVNINPNSNIPALLNLSTSNPTWVCESVAIMLYLAEKFEALLPTKPSARAECLFWVFWHIGSAPYLGGVSGHFYAHAP